MRHLFFLITLLSLAMANPLQAQNDSIYFWKAGAMIHKQSIKPADLDSITFRRPPSNLAGPEVTDIDGNLYQSVTNCYQTWTKQNLNVSKYTDGTPIPQVTDPTAWANLTTGAWCYYNNDPANEATYGKLYNWYAAVGIYDAASLANPALRKKLAPVGWHVPTDTEWTTLTDCLGGLSVAGGKIKTTTGWNTPNVGATNSSGFTALPGGGRYFSGTFGLITFTFNCWSSTESTTDDAWSRYINSDYSNVYRFDYTKKYGFSVRCIKD